MRKLFAIIALLLSASCLFAGSRGTIDIGGTLCPTDTLARYQVGPGTWYTRLNISIGTRSLGLYMMEVDLTDPYVTLEARNGGGSVGQNESMVTAHHLLDSAGHRPVGAVNCNFFWQPHTTLEGLQWQPTGGTAHDGVLVTNPDDWTMHANQISDPRWRDMGYMALDYQKRVWMEQMLWDGKMILPDGSIYNLRDCNRYRTNPNANEIAIFNPGYGSRPTRTFDTGSELIFTVDRWRINSDLHCTVVSRNTTGGTVLTDGQGCLQARGSGDAFIQHLQPGDTFRINLGIYAPHIGNARPDIKEMAMGNALCMVDSQLICRNWNETYNTDVYARTGIATNSAGNRFWMMVMEKPGMSTEEMCYVFRAAGASYAAGCDGGGSAEMEVLGEIMNTTTEGTPRAINTMIFAMSTAPDDEVISRLVFNDGGTTRVSAYSSYTPAMRAYNQYGAMLSGDFTDYTLSCTPADLGTISADGKTFTAGPIAGSGTLTATYGGVSVSKQITVEEGQVNLALDSVWIDTRDYPILAYSISDGKQLQVNPAYFSWTVDNPEVCEVSAEGVLRGIRNGETDIHGTLGSSHTTMHVTAEIADAPLFTQTRFLDADTAIWTLKNSSNAICWGMTADSTSTLNFAVSSARNPQISLTGNMRLYSLPDSIELLVESPVKLKSVGLIALPRNSNTQVSVALTPENNPNQLCSYKAAISDFGVDTTDIAIWPMKLIKIVLTLTDVSVKTPYEVKLYGIRLYYHNYTVVSRLDDCQAEEPAEKLLKDGQVIIRRAGREYDILGREVK